MSRTWNDTFNAEPDGTDAGSTLDDVINELKSEIEKRMNTLVDNWENDPDTPTVLDLTDGCVDTEHLAADAVIGDKIADSAVDTEHLADDAVEEAKITLLTPKVAATSSNLSVPKILISASR